jgi:pimeloyl-ACP methyl ester carboxylesterase
MTPIVFIPGMLCSAELFAPQIAALWPYGPVTVASTLEGATIGEMAAAILASAPPRFALVGLSMGGYIAFEIMRQAPERVIKLALLDTSARADTPEETEQRRGLVAAANSGDFIVLLENVMTSVLHPEHQDDAALRAINVRMGLTVGLDGLERQQQAMSARIDSRPGLAAISIPTLVLVGDSDPLTPPFLSEEIAAAIPGARLVIVQQCGHGSTLEQPEIVNRCLIDLLVGETALAA